MSLDIRTLFILTVVNSLLLGAAQLIIWMTQRSNRSLALWAMSNFIGAAGSFMVALRGFMPDWISIALGNALIIAWLLLLWAGTRRFDGQVLPTPLIAGGTMGVFAVMLLPPVAENLAVRAVLIGLLNGLLLCAVTLDLWRAQHKEPLVIRRFLIVVFIVAAIPCFLRAAYSAGLDPSGDFMTAGAVQAAMLLHMNLFILAWNVGGLLMVNERMQKILSRAASTDELTGLLNQQEFFARAERLLARARIDDDEAAILMIGVRHLPSYNVYLGNTATDDSMRSIASTISAHTRPEDLLCRIGGEQFALLLSDCDMHTATEVAERICSDIDRRAIPHAGTPKGIATIIVGISAGKAIEFASARALAQAADAALLNARHSHQQRIAHFTTPKRYSQPSTHSDPVHDL